MEQNPSGGFDPGRLRDVQRWRRSRSDRMIAGVCGGIGRALDIDPVLVRVVMAVLALAGVGLPLYIACWLLMPEEGSDTAPVQSVLGDRARPDHPWLWPLVLAGAVCVGIGFASSSQMWPFSFPGWLIGAVILYFVVFRKKGRCRNRHGHWHAGQWHTGAHNWRPSDTPTTPSTQSPAPPPESSPYPASSASSATPGPAGASTVASGAAGQPVWTEDDPLGLYVDEEPTPTPRPAAAPQRRPGLRGVKPVVAALTGLAILIAWVSGSTLPAMMAIGLVTLGTGMLLGGFVGRTLGLLPIGILLALAVASTSIFDTVPRKVGDLKFTATPDQPITAIHPAYTMDLGSIKLDLRKAKFEPGAKVVARAKLGEIVVILPPEVDVTGTMSAKAGELRGLGGVSRDGKGLDLAIEDLGKDNKLGPTAVNLDLDMTAGSIRVERG